MKLTSVTGKVILYRDRGALCKDGDIPDAGAARPRDDPPMDADRAQAYGVFVRLLRGEFAAHLTEEHQRRLRHAADELIFASAWESPTTWAGVVAAVAVIAELQGGSVPVDVVDEIDLLLWAIGPDRRDAAAVA